MYEIKWLTGQHNKKCDVVNKIHQTDCMWFQNVEISLPNQDIIFLNYRQQIKAVLLPNAIGLWLYVYQYSYRSLISSIFFGYGGCLL